MLDFILLYFLAKKIGCLAIKKGLSPLRWKLTMIGVWLFFEVLGFVFGVLLFGTKDLYSLLAFCIVCAFGGYLLIKYILENKPDNNINKEIDSIEINDLAP